MNSDNPVSIVLPCFNPPVGWELIVISNFIKLSESISIKELIIVNDGSNRNFDIYAVEKIFAQFPVKIISYKENRGKGYALREGVKQASANFIIYTDIDFPYTIESFLDVYSSLKGYIADLAVGVRSESYYKHLPITRVRISKFLRNITAKFIQIPVNDTQCGLKGFNESGKAIFSKTTIDRFLFDLEFIFLASRQKLRIKAVQVELRQDVQLSRMPMKTLMQEFGNFLKILYKGWRQ